MDYKKFGEDICVRFDKGDEIIAGILKVCEKEKILSATYSGIGGCGNATVATLNQETNEFIPHSKTGLLELISLNGNISADENDNIFHHTHAIFSYIDNNGEIKFLGGHMLSAEISYTGEILIHPIKNGIIRRMKDNNTGITVWKL